MSKDSQYCSMRESTSERMECMPKTFTFYETIYTLVDWLRTDDGKIQAIYSHQGLDKTYTMRVTLERIV